MWEIPENVSKLQMREKENKCLGEKRFMLDNNVLYTVDNEHKHLLAVGLKLMYLAHAFPGLGTFAATKHIRGSVQTFIGPPCTVKFKNIAAHAQLQPFPIVSTAGLPRTLIIEVVVVISTFGLPVTLQTGF